MSLQDPSRHILAVSAGIVGEFLPNKKSNIHPLLMGAILALLLVKVLLGDLDYGFQFSSRDMLFVAVFAAEGALGAWIAQKSMV